MGVPIGSSLVHIATGETVEVIDPKKVRLRGDVVSLTRAQQIVSGADYAVAPGRHWSFNEVLISTLYETTYPATMSGD